MSPRRLTSRRMRLESLETRQLMAANLYLDFGAAFEPDPASGNHTFKDYAQLYADANQVFDGAHYNFAGLETEGGSLNLEQVEFLESTISRVPEHLNGSLADPVFGKQIDYNQDGRLDYDDATYPDNTRERRDFLVTSLANTAAHEAAHRREFAKSLTTQSRCTRIHEEIALAARGEPHRWHGRNWLRAVNWSSRRPEKS